MSKKTGSSANSLNSLVADYITLNGEDAFVALIKKSAKQESQVLTIIVNAGVHPVLAEHKRGEVFIASSGNIDFSSKKNIENEFREILLNVAKKLQSQNWNKIYIVPYGPSVLSMLIKNLVYRVLYINTVDILHVGSGVHYDIDFDLREIAIEADAKLAKSKI